LKSLTIWPKPLWLAIEYGLVVEETPEIVLMYVRCFACFHRSILPSFYFYRMELTGL
jgi:hypothetical protein